MSWEVQVNQQSQSKELYWGDTVLRGLSARPCRIIFLFSLLGGLCKWYVFTSTQEELRGVDDGASQCAEASEEHQEEGHDGHVQPAEQYNTLW